MGHDSRERSAEDAVTQDDPVLAGDDEVATADRRPAATRRRRDTLRVLATHRLTAHLAGDPAVEAELHLAE